MTEVATATEEAAAPGPLTDDQARMLDGYWRAANYLAVGQIYLMANPLLAEVRNWAWPGAVTPS